MFHSAALRLTGWYLAIIMALSIGTSIALYHVSTGDLERNSQRQVGYFNGLLGPRDTFVYNNLRQGYLNEDRSHLKANLFIFNAFVLLGGGAISYALARRTLEPIEDALDAQKRFTADASHELRTPLTAMQTENEVALRSQSLTKTQAVNLLKSNLEEVGKLKALSEGLLALANSENNTDFYQVLSTVEIINAAVGRVQKAASAKKIDVKQPAAPDLTVKGNQQNLADLLVIILDNAIKYSPPGSTVRVEAKRKDKYAQISVADNGPGIEAKELPHIFDRFYRADASRHKSGAGGYGLGLAIAKKLADAHHAHIDVRSTPGKGSTFTLNLPIG